jgi:hypothetical protein
LSFYLIRLGQLNEAMEVLRDQSAQRSGHFMVFANQATIYQMLANSGSARDRTHNLGYARLSLSDALRAWPKKGWPGWDRGQEDWYRQVEQYNLQMIRLRAKEAKEQAVRKESTDDKPFEDVDALFPLNWDNDKKSPLRFVAEDGQYQPGQLAAAQRAKLTGKELPIVQQLLTWLPQDDRLYWLLGELLNIQEGDSSEQTAQNKQAAAGILDDCVWNRKLSNVPLLMQHRKVLKEALVVEEPTWLQRYWHYVVIGVVGALLLILLAYFQIRENRKRRARSITGPHT